MESRGHSPAHNPTGRGVLGRFYADVGTAGFPSVTVLSDASSLEVYAPGEFTEDEGLYMSVEQRSKLESAGREFVNMPNRAKLAAASVLGWANGYGGLDIEVFSVTKFVDDADEVGCQPCDGCRSAKISSWVVMVVTSYLRPEDRVADASSARLLQGISKGVREIMHGMLLAGLRTVGCFQMLNRDSYTSVEELPGTLDKNSVSPIGCVIGAWNRVTLDNNHTARGSVVRLDLPTSVEEIASLGKPYCGQVDQSNCVHRLPGGSYSATDLLSDAWKVFLISDRNEIQLDDVDTRLADAVSYEDTYGSYHLAAAGTFSGIVPRFRSIRNPQVPGSLAVYFRDPMDLYRWSRRQWSMNVLSVIDERVKLDGVLHEMPVETSDGLVRMLRTCSGRYNCKDDDFWSRMASGTVGEET